MKLYEFGMTKQIKWILFRTVIHTKKTEITIK